MSSIGLFTLGASDRSSIQARHSPSVAAARKERENQPDDFKTTKEASDGFANIPSRPGEALASSTHLSDKLASPNDHHAASQHLEEAEDEFDEKTPLINDGQSDERRSHEHMRSHIPFSKRLSGAIVGTVRLVFAAILAPGRYLVACFYDDQDGRFSPLMPVHRISRLLGVQRRKSASEPMKMSGNEDEKDQGRKRPTPKRRPSRLSKKPTSDEPRLPGNGEPTVTAGDDEDSPSRHTRSRSLPASNYSSGDESDHPSKSKRSIRINMNNDEALRQRKQQREHADTGSRRASNGSSHSMLTVDTLKSPTSPLSPSALTRYPRLPAPPRPLIPKRQPSYATTLPTQNPRSPQKTLVIDLDETLIHSMAKGGRMSTGHMVEVKLNTPIGAGGQILGPQVPILYYVHKRPFCDDFLRKVSKWYNLVVFTASVQEYADPVIDWLELEKKYFSARYYRQHCTFRNGAYIKDLSSVEPDLSRVMILDNSPMSYVFHEDNAIPIEGWISDPTDTDLMHLVPLLEGLQYATDVRALLALRLGEARNPVL